MKTNEQIYEDIKTNGFIAKLDLQLLKNRSNREQKDLFDYNFLDSFKDGYGIPVSDEQGKQGLTWLKKFIHKDGTSNVFGWRELNVIKNAKSSDFLFRGFYQIGTGYFKKFAPIYQMGEMEYVPLKEPYIIS